jgi:cell fate (sporulation/competence/biofilm development) regulator YmcA (YheA/YmcA/DUF963 family)
MKNHSFVAAAEMRHIDRRVKQLQECLDSTTNLIHFTEIELIINAYKLILKTYDEMIKEFD